MSTYIHNKEVEPAPVVGKIFLEAVCNPLEEHFKHEDVGEDFVSILQHHLNDFSLLDIDILKCLQQCRKSSVRKHSFIIYSDHHHTITSG